MIIYPILSSKPHNPHYLSRYIKFIHQCFEQNKNIDAKTYTEKHHICPKADDLFSEYKNFRKYKWNKVVLTARQHFIAHHLLWKTFPKSSAAFAFKCFIDGFGKNINSISSKTYELLKIQTILKIKEINTGKVTVRNLESGLCSTITKEEYHSPNRPSNIVFNVIGTIPVYDTITGEYSRITKEEYYSPDRNDNLVSKSKNKVKVINLITKQTFEITKEEYYENIFPHIVSIREGYVHTEETKQKQRKPKKTSENMKANKSEQHKENMRIARLENVKTNRVCCILTRKEYPYNSFVRHVLNKKN